MKNRVPMPPSGVSRGDIIHSTVKAVGGAVPFVGAAVSEAIDKAVTAPAEKRQTIWLKIVAKTVNQLLDSIEGLTPEKLGQNEAFLTAVIATTQSAMLTARKEKLAILQAVIQKIGSGVVLDEVMRNTFLAVVDRYTPEHVALLKKLADQQNLKNAFERIREASPSKINESSSEGGSVKIEDLIPFMFECNSPEIVKELFSDLHRDRFCYGSEGFAHTIYLNNPHLPHLVVTVRGQEFLNFITSE